VLADGSGGEEPAAASAAAAEPARGALRSAADAAAAAAQRRGPLRSRPCSRPPLGPRRSAAGCVPPLRKGPATRPAPPHSNCPGRSRPFCTLQVSSPSSPSNRYTATALRRSLCSPTHVPLLLFPCLLPAAHAMSMCLVRWGWCTRWILLRAADQLGATRPGRPCWRPSHPLPAPALNGAGPRPLSASASTSGALSAPARNIPPHDLTARSPQGAYPLSLLVPEEEWEATDPAPLLLAANEPKPAACLRTRPREGGGAYPHFVLSRLKHLTAVVSPGLCWIPSPQGL